MIVRDSVRTMPPLLLIGGRFSLAFLALFMLFPRRLSGWRENARPGLALAGLLFCGFILQTYGLRHTTASASGFITGLNVIFVAAIAAVVQGRLPRRTVWSAILAFAGLLLLSWHPGGWRFGPGDLLTLGCALFFALHIVATGRLAPGRDPVILSMIQFGAVALFSLALNGLWGGDFRLPAGIWPSLFYLGLGGTAFAFLIQTAAQKHTPAVDTAVIFAAEPLFAAAIAVLFGGERLTPPMIMGGGSIFGAMLLSTIHANRRSDNELPPRAPEGR